MMVFIPAHCKRILDVGCGEGFFGKAIKEKFPEIVVHGIEKNKKAAVKAKKNLDAVINLDINKALNNVSDTFYDCVVFNDLLEHLADPIDILLKIKPKLKKDGIILASIPNVRYFPIITDLLIHKNWTYADEGILDYTHLRFFTENSIPIMFESAGYSVYSIVGINENSFGWGFKLLNLLCLGKLSDMRYLQFACLAKIKQKPHS